MKSIKISNEAYAQLMAITAGENAETRISNKRNNWNYKPTTKERMLEIAIEFKYENSNGFYDDEYATDDEKKEHNIIISASKKAYEKAKRFGDSLHKYNK